MSARLVVEFDVDGVPVQQGSKTSFINPRTGRAGMKDQNEMKLRPWRSTVTAAAVAVRPDLRIDGDVLVVAEFRFVRPRSVSVRKRPRPSVKPDLDKLTRSLLDSITDSGIWRDDAQVVSLHVSKIYADRPGVHVQVGEYSTDEPPTKESSK